MYLGQTEGSDVFAVNAMIFSLISLMVGTFQQISHRLNDYKYTYTTNAGTDDDVVKIDCTTKNVFKMTIEWNKLRKQHVYTYSLITDALCSTLKIDEEMVQVFYIVQSPQQDKMYVYFALEPSPIFKLMVEDEHNSQQWKQLIVNLNQIGVQGDKLSEIFKQQIGKRLGIKLTTKQIKLNNTNTQPGVHVQATTVVFDMNIKIENASKKMSQHIR